MALTAVAGDQFPARAQFESRCRRRSRTAFCEGERQQDQTVAQHLSCLAPLSRPVGVVIILPELGSATAYRTRLHNGEYVTKLLAGLANPRDQANRHHRSGRHASKPVKPLLRRRHLAKKVLREILFSCALYIGMFRFMPPLRRRNWRFKPLREYSLENSPVFIRRPKWFRRRAS